MLGNLQRLWQAFALLFWSTIAEGAFQSLPLVPHHVQQRRRRRLLKLSSNNETDPVQQRRSRLSQDRSLRAQQVGALYQGYGTHYVDLWCGTTSPQRQTVIVDTGSAVTAFPCSGCRDFCGKDYHIDQVFEESQSTTFETLACSACMRGRCTVVSGEPKENNCKIGMSYQEGSSWTAFEASDYCYVGGPHGVPLPIKGADAAKAEDPPGDVDQDGASTADVDPNLAANHAFRLVFGCQTKLTGLFKTQLADGIMGMDNAHESFWHQMSAAGGIDEDVFTLCFARQPTADRQGTEAGAMTLGGVDTRLNTSPIVYASVGVSNAFYGVHLRNVYLRKGGGGDSATSTNPTLLIKRVDISEAELNRGTTIVDSGTTDTYFTRSIATSFRALWKEMTGKDYNNNPVNLSKEQLDALPTILFQLQGLTDVNKKLAEESGGPLVGLVGDLDADHPYDVLLAMPPSHYMEYDTDVKKYVPRFYTDEGRGSVLGANVMMGHNIVFDQVNGRLGIAESQCDYAGLVTGLGFEWKVHEQYSMADHAEDNGLPEPTGEDEAEEKAEQVDNVEKENQKDGEGENKKMEASKETEDSDDAAEEGTGGGGLTWTVGLAAVLVAAVAGVLVRRRPTSGSAIPVPYTEELELQNQLDDEDGEFGQYRDDADEDEDFEDEDLN